MMLQISNWRVYTVRRYEVRKVGQNGIEFNRTFSPTDLGSKILRNLSDRKRFFSFWRKSSHTRHWISHPHWFIHAHEPFPTGGKLSPVGAETRKATVQTVTSQIDQL